MRFWHKLKGYQGVGLFIRAKGVQCFSSLIDIPTLWGICSLYNVLVFDASNDVPFILSSNKFFTYQKKK